jgi:hypothetical protein
MQMLESEHAIHGLRSQTIRANRSRAKRIRGKTNRPIIREIRRTIISRRGARTTKTNGNDK